MDADHPTTDRLDAPLQVRTERLLLRGWRPQDREPFAAMNEDPEVMRYIGSGVLPRDASEGMRARLRREWVRAGHGLWAIEPLEGGELLGFCGLTRPAWGGTAVQAELEVGWRLRREAWGHGYATEAARAALDVAWGALRLERVICLIHPDNARSLGVAERLGMRVVGTTVHPPTRWRILVLRAERPDSDSGPRDPDTVPDTPPQRP